MNPSWKTLKQLPHFEYAPWNVKIGDHVFTIRFETELEVGSKTKTVFIPFWVKCED